MIGIRTVLAAVMMTGGAPAVCAPPVPAAPPPATAENAVPTTPVDVPDDYRLDTGDAILIDVLRHADVSRVVRLQADARIRLPRLQNPISARGKTCPELVREITERLTSEGKLVLRPGQVSVSVTEMRIRRIYVRGNAGRNGDFDLKNGWRVTELYAVMGGVSNPERVTARLVNPRRPNSLPIDLTAALKDADSPDNVLLMEGDTLVLTLPQNKRFFVKGQGPRGMHELDERFGLRQALIQLGFDTANSQGDLRNAVLIRRAVPGDPNSAEIRTKVDLYALLTDDTRPEVPLHDLDTLDIPMSQRFIYIYGEMNSPRKWYLPEDRPTYLVDIMALGSTTNRAKIDDIKIWRLVEGKPTVSSYKFGKFLSKGDVTQNPEILPQDVVFVPDVKRPDYVSNIWQAWGLFGIVQAVFPGTRLR